MSEYVRVLRKYAVFSGRAARREHWMFVLVNAVITLGLVLVEERFGLAPDTDTYVLADRYGLAVFLPGLAVTFRRLHDTDHSGAWVLLGFIPVLGAIVLLVMLVHDSDRGTNRHGPNPKTAGAA